MMIEKGVERMIRLSFEKLSKFQKLPVIYLNIYHRDIGLSKWYLQGRFHFHWLELQQVQELLGKKQMKLEKRRVTSTDLKINHEIYLTVKKIYTENSDRRNYFLAAFSVFLF